MLQSVGEGMLFQEDHSLASADLCRWIIDFKEDQLGDQVGIGSYGAVYKGRRKGVALAVKKFIKQKLAQLRMPPRWPSSPSSPQYRSNHR